MNSAKRKHLVYIDAENLNQRQILEFYESVKEETKEKGQLLVSKFYGGKEAVRDVFYTCMELGMEFVDTDGMIRSRKNVTDMKMMVDAIADFFTLYNADVDEITVCSCDCDFIPLVYKLMGFGVKVNTPFLDFEAETSKPVSIAVKLQEKGFDTWCRKNVFKPVLRAMVECLADEVPEQEVVVYFAKKRNKLMKELSYILPQSTLDKLNELDNDVFCLGRLLDAVGRENICTVERVTNAYTQKMFGFSLTANILSKKLGGLYAAC